MRVGLVIRGTVQGVGFRPFVYRTARGHGVTGFVRNGRDGVHVEAQADAPTLEGFVAALVRDLPRAAVIRSVERTTLVEVDECAFLIVSSDGDDPVAPVLPPDLGTCGDCFREVSDPENRRYRYPFTNCVACGPRFSICLGLPYDRARTSMGVFPMCEECSREYHDVNDRRYHAQPTACAACGPTLALVDMNGGTLARGDAALVQSIAALGDGKVLALRGLGGFQLLCAAHDAVAVARLRERKRRPHKPFGVLFRDVRAVEDVARLSDAEREALRSAEAPIVLVVRRAGQGTLAENVSPNSPYVGALLPSTPLHRLLLDGAKGPLVCTSGNVSEEPICIDDAQVRDRLGAVADLCLTHDRAVVRPLDDSVVRVTGGRTAVLRRARGYAPRAVGTLPVDASVLAFGAHLKSTVTLGHRGALVPSQHLGDLDAPSTRALVLSTIDDLLAFFEAEPRLVACDLHPDYGSTLLAEEFAAARGLPVLRLQHHHAHVAAVMAEHALVGRDVLGLSWDGAGLGDDGTIWGGEALRCRDEGFTRAASIERFPLPGGDAASRDPRRAALGLVFAHAPEALDGHVRPLFGAAYDAHLGALEARTRAPVCSSIGRLFDAVAGLLGAGPVTFEGEAAMGLEAIAATAPPDGAYSLPLEDGVGRLSPLLHDVFADLRRGTDRARVARRFHEALVSFGVQIAEHVGVERVALGGGCFQSALLVDGLTSELTQRGFQVHVAEGIPANDGGISVGQAWLAAFDVRAHGASPRPPWKPTTTE